MDELWMRMSWNLVLCIPFGTLIWCLCRIPWIHSRPAVCHGLWLLVLFKLVTPPFISIPILPATGPSAPKESKFSAEHFTSIADLSPSSIESEQQLPVVASIPNVSQSPDRGESRTTVAPESLAARLSKINLWRTATIALVVASLATTLAVWFASFRQLQRLQRLLRDRESPSERVTQLLADLAPRFRPQTIPDLVIVDSPIAPLVLSGPRQVIIVLSQQLIQSLEDEEIQNVLAHELAHLERRDQWSNLFSFFVATVFWWHPVAWFARRERCLAAESCCDIMVLELLSRIEKVIRADLAQSDGPGRSQQVVAACFGAELLRYILIAKENSNDR